MHVEYFRELLRPITDFLSSQAVNAALTAKINRQFPADGDTFNAVEAACHEAIADGWMCTQGAPGRRFGRILEASEDSGGLSVDVVDLANIVGPHHRHPRGEICMVMPITAGARFDGTARGWCVFEPGSAHCPTVTGGEAIVLYLLPGGEIEFTQG